jgi:hypothetical protein
VPIDPNSGAYIDYMQENIVGDFVMLSGADEDGAWGTPIYWAEPTDPVYHVTSRMSRGTAVTGELPRRSSPSGGTRWRRA